MGVKVRNALISILRFVEEYEVTEKTLNDMINTALNKYLSTY